MKTITPLAIAAALLAASIPVKAATAPQIDPAARELLGKVEAKLAAAQTIRLKAKHKLPATVGSGGAQDSGPLEISVMRPNRFYVIQQVGKETKELVYDGKSITLMHPGLKHHAVETLKAASIAEFADKADARLGFRPPVAELLSADLANQLFSNATSVRLVGKESVGWTSCQHVQILQDGLMVDLWIGAKDLLPRRYRVTFTALQERPEWDIRFSKWELNAPLDASLFSKQPAADSQKIKMLKSR